MANSDSTSSVAFLSAKVLRTPAASVLLGAAVLIGMVALRKSPAERLREPLTTEQLSELTASYSKGAWRLGRHALGNSALTLSHVVVLHRESDGTAANFRAPGWEPSAPPTRTRTEAKAMAAQLARTLIPRPDLFEEFARMYSEDVVTRERGGSLGSWSAALIPPTMLDALATMKVGEVSRVVETSFGFHVIKLRPTPPDQKIAARRVLIGYAGTSPGLLRPGRTPSRSRKEAFALAHDVARQARANAGDFSTLVARYSDHSDAVRNGSIGVWSTRRAGFRNIELELLAGLPMGGISEPIDSFEGVNVFIRDPLGDTTAVAWEQVLPALSKSEPKLPRPTADELSKRVAQMLERLAREPGYFDELRRSYCCDKVEQAPLGQGLPIVEAAVTSIAVGAVLPRALEVLPGDFRIVRRVAPQPANDDPPVLATLPSKSEPDLEFMLKNARSGPALADYVLALHKRAGSVASLGLDERGRARISEIMFGLATRLGTVVPEQRMSSVTQALGSIAGEFGDSVAGKYRASIMAELVHDMN